MSQEESFPPASQSKKAIEPECRAPAASPGAVMRGSVLGRVLMAVGVSGAVLAALCCVAPFLLAGVLAAVGLSFLLKDAVLLLLLALFFSIAMGIISSAEEN